MQLLKRRLNQLIQRRTGLSPIDRTDPNDVFIVGYPKSGNTWMQNLVAAVVFGIDPHLTPDKLINDLVLDVHYRAFYRRYATPTFFKSHHLPRPEYRRVVYLLRDGRDTMVSYFHYLSALNGRTADFLQMVTLGEGLFPCRWHEHVEAWMANPYRAEMITIRYESLQDEPVQELKKFCQFAALERTSEFLQQAADACSFEAMREREKKIGWDSNRWSKEKAFVRRGKVGSFKDEMPPAAAMEFLRQAEPTLVRVGYPIN